MNGELDLELYNISIIRLNNALENIENNEDAFRDISNTFQGLYEDIINDLNNDEIQFNEYYLFFENGKTAFPQYIESLKEIENEKIQESIDSLINVFENLNRIAEAFPSRQGI